MSWRPRPVSASSSAAARSRSPGVSKDRTTRPVPARTRSAGRAPRNAIAWPIDRRLTSPRPTATPCGRPSRSTMERRRDRAVGAGLGRLEVLGRRDVVGCGRNDVLGRAIVAGATPPSAACTSTTASTGRPRTNRTSSPGASRTCSRPVGVRRMPVIRSGRRSPGPERRRRGGQRGGGASVDEVAAGQPDEDRPGQGQTHEGEDERQRRAAGRHDLVEQVAVRDLETELREIETLARLRVVHRPLLASEEPGHGRVA